MAAGKAKIFVLVTLWTPPAGSDIATNNKVSCAPECFFGAVEIAGGGCCVAKEKDVTLQHSTLNARLPLHLHVQGCQLILQGSHGLYPFGMYGVPCSGTSQIFRRLQQYLISALLLLVLDISSTCLSPAVI